MSTLKPPPNNAQFGGWTPPRPPKGCASTLEHEREQTAMAEALEAKAKLLLVSNDRIQIATAKECALAAARLRKQAGHLALEREATDHVNHLERLERERLGIWENPFHAKRKRRR